MASTITQHKIVLNPLENPRTWLAFAVAVLCLVAATQLPRGWDLVGVVRILLLGCAGYIGSAAVEHLPVRGMVSTEGSTAFMGRIAQFGYVPAEETAQGRTFVRKSASPLRAMFGPIIVGRPVGSEFPVTVPLRFYRTLKRIQA
ncbi:MAG TPA: hypothetical protein VN089_05645 [Duganella sp.]|nr:hypothetical protein [Duganella sp.]